MNNIDFGILQHYFHYSLSLFLTVFTDSLQYFHSHSFTVFLPNKKQTNFHSEKCYLISIQAENMRSSHEFTLSNLTQSLFFTQN